MERSVGLGLQPEAHRPQTKFTQFTVWALECVSKMSQVDSGRQNRLLTI